MTTFNEANQVRLKLKMQLCQYAWYCSSLVHAMDDGFGIIITVKQIDNNVRKIIAPVIDGVCVKVETE